MRACIYYILANDEKKMNQKKSNKRGKDWVLSYVAALKDEEAEVWEELCDEVRNLPSQKELAEIPAPEKTVL